MEMSLEVEVAMWREDLRVREEEARLREAVEEAREEDEERLEELAQMAMQRQLRLLSSDSGVFCRRAGLYIQHTHSGLSRCYNPLNAGFHCGG